MKKIVYLFGSGAVQAELQHKQVESDVVMTGLNKGVYEISKNNAGEYFKFTQQHPIQPFPDVELMMSLLESFSAKRRRDFAPLYEELRRLVREYLIKEITSKKIEPNLMTSLLHLSENYAEYMEVDGEELLGALTTNYDSLLEEAFLKVHGRLNLGVRFSSRDYVMNNKMPCLLKLHGSFNWRIRGSKLFVSKKYETLDATDDFTGWIPPSVYKKPSFKVFEKIWEKAYQLLTSCDILRVVGSSLRSQDWCMISLIFTSRVKSKKRFDIELILPEKDAVGDDEHPDGILQRLPFFGEAKSLSALPLADESLLLPNPTFRWLNAKAKEIEGHGGSFDQDEIIHNMLYKEKE